MGHNIFKRVFFYNASEPLLVSISYYLPESVIHHLHMLDRGRTIVHYQSAFFVSKFISPINIVSI